MSVSEDGKAMWDWHTSESAVCVLDVHVGAVRSISVNSDGWRVFTCANDGKLRTWDICTGTETEELSRDNAVRCVAVCGEIG